MSVRTTKPGMTAATVERVAIYCRISEDPRQKEAGVGRQEADGRALVTARPGWELAGVYIDNDISVLKAGVVRHDVAGVGGRVTADSRTLGSASSRE